MLLKYEKNEMTWRINNWKYKWLRDVVPLSSLFTDSDKFPFFPLLNHLYLILIFESFITIHSTKLW